MSKFINHRELFNGIDILPNTYGFHTISIHGENIPINDIMTWITFNVSGEWTTWTFYSSDDMTKSNYGQSYSFENEEDKVKFILRWI